MTVEEARKHRQIAESVILAALQKLSRDTGLDIVAVQPYIVVAAGDGDPRRIVQAVRIDLAV